MEPVPGTLPLDAGQGWRLPDTRRAVVVAPTETYKVHTSSTHGPRADRGILLFHLIPARRKARQVAIAEALSVLRDLEPEAPPGGPLSDRGGLFWISVPTRLLEPARARLPRLGYTTAVDLAEPVPPGTRGANLTRWRNAWYRLVRMHEESPEALRERAVDRRVFLLETRHGEIRPVRGYRGAGGPLSKRGLPVCDARLLTNLVFRPELGALLDPFAGTGGIVIEALASGWSVTSTEIDPDLRHGLAEKGAIHHVADARALPFADASFDAVATEPPYEPEAESTVCTALRELHRVLRAGGRLALMCADRQAEPLRREAASLSLASYLDAPVNRKGLSVVVLAWRKR
ncbi:MAG: methyltransferase domain-containing protein [Chloroflexota bacterium]|nr:methyltransferase domain-containing protein [Chloroflexota bacterium]